MGSPRLIARANVIGAIDHLLLECGGLTTGERLVLVFDATTSELAADFLERARVAGAGAQGAEIEVADRHGVEPPEDVARLMASADLGIGLTRMSLAHTRARRALCDSRGRYLSLPGYSYAMLEDPSVMADYRAQLATTEAIANAFTAGSTVRVTTPAGTDLRLDITGREGNCCPGFLTDEYRMGSPPDIEANISPLEWASQGVAVIDGSVACDEIGLLEEPVVITVRDGAFVGATSGGTAAAATVEKIFARIGDAKAYLLAECGIGLNPLARVTGNMLIDEGAMGCVHLGFGSNVTVGGANDVPFHLDFIMRNASVWIDDEQVLDRGSIHSDSVR